MIEEPRCSVRRCRHFGGARATEPGVHTGAVPVCAAFPRGIPASIAYGSDPHDVPRLGQGNVLVFEEEV